MADKGPSLRGKLTLDTKPFSNSLKNARKNSNSAFAQISKSSQTLATGIKAAAIGFAGLFAGRAIAGLFNAGKALDDVRDSIRSLIPDAERQTEVFREIDDVANRTGQSNAELSHSFIELQKVGLGNARALELASDAATTFDKSTQQVSKALATLRGGSLKQIFGFDEVKTSGDRLTATLNGIVVAQGRTRAEFRASLLDFIASGNAAGAAARNAGDASAAYQIWSNTIATISATLRTVFGPALATIATFAAQVADSMFGVSAASQEAFAGRAVEAVNAFITKIVGLKEAIALQVVFIKQAIEDFIIKPFEKLKAIPFIGKAFQGLEAIFKKVGAAIAQNQKETDEWAAGFGKAKREALATAPAIGKVAAGAGHLSTSVDESTGGLHAFSDALKDTRDDLAATASAAFNTADAISSVGDASDNAGSGGGSSGSGGRQTQSLGAVADFNDPASIERAIARTVSQQQAVFRSGGAGLGFSEIQGRTLATQLAELQAALKAANAKRDAEIIDGIINATRGQGLTSEQVTQQINDELAIRRRYNLQPTSGGSVSGFTSLQGARF